MTEKKSVVAISAFGGPDRLRLMQMPIPIPGPDEVLIRVPAAGVGLWEANAHRGTIISIRSRLGIGWHR